MDVDESSSSSTMAPPTVIPSSPAVIEPSQSPSDSRLKQISGDSPFPSSPRPFFPRLRRGTPPPTSRSRSPSPSASPTTSGSAARMSHHFNPSSRQHWGYKFRESGRSTPYPCEEESVTSSHPPTRSSSSMCEKTAGLSTNATSVASSARSPGSSKRRYITLLADEEEDDDNGQLDAEKRSEGPYTAGDDDDPTGTAGSDPGPSKSTPLSHAVKASLPRSTGTLPSATSSGTYPNRAFSTGTLTADSTIDGLPPISSLTQSTVTVSGATKMAMAAMAAKSKGKGRELNRNGSGDGADDSPMDGVTIDAEGQHHHPLSERSLSSRGYITQKLFSHSFHLESRWSNLRELGQGAYGLVVSAQDSFSGETIAIKLLTRVFDKIVLARRCLREITLLRHLNGHENITGLIDLDIIVDDFSEIYMFMEPMEADLHQIIRSGQKLTNSHIQYFLYQVLRGMKPGNLLVNADCELKICDFGLARGYRPDPSESDPNSMQAGGALTEYVATRWYRAPEIMLSYRNYTTAIDVWSIGCILAELLGGRPIFKGKDYIDQLNLIIGKLGSPTGTTLRRIASEKANTYMRSLPIKTKIPLETLYLDADPQAVDLLSKMLTFDPAERITVDDALKHPYMATYHDPTDEPDCPAAFDKWQEVEALQSMEELRHAIKREVMEFREEVRTVEEWEMDETADVGDSTTEADAEGESPDDTEQARVDQEFRSSGRESPYRSPFASVASTPRSIASELSQDPTPPPSTLGERRRSRAGSGTTSSDPFVRRPSSMFSGFGLGLGGMGFTPMSGSMPDRHGGSHARMSSMSGGEGRSKSRTSSQSSFARPLVRALSSLSVVDLHRDAAGREISGDHPPPMSVSPSDAPPSEAPLTFGSRKARKGSDPEEVLR